MISLNNKNKKAIIAMSGGVDSSVAAYIVKNMGYDLCGITLKLYADELYEPNCCSDDDIEDAKKVAEILGFPHEVYNFTDNFKEKVIDKFVRTYKEGGTPNPCIECNRHLKFEKLIKKAEEDGFDYVVTGHYAKVEYDEKLNRFLLKKAEDTTKDQTYVLYSLTQKQLSKTMFPLGTLTKEKVRELAESLDFVNADKPDSQDICFVKDGDYFKFIEDYTGEKSIPGKFLDKEGNVLGTHKGIINYTIGQRKGLGLSLKAPMFVCEKNVSDNMVILGYTKDLMSKTLTATDVNLIMFDKLDGPLRVNAKTRYNQKEAPATVTPLEDGRIKVEFDEPQRAITKGQAVVLYIGDTVVGGGTIE